jgi:hypothetical protein
MPKILIVGNEEFEFPIEGENPGYGSEVSDWAEAVTTALETVQKPNDIPTTSQIPLTQLNINTPTNIPGFAFSTAEVIAIDSKYIFTKTYVLSGNTVVVTEVGFIEGFYDLTNWSISVRTVGDAGVSITIQPSGQMQYTLTTAFPTGSTSRTLNIAYEAKVINR